MRVLVVEDEPLLAEAIRDGLRLEAIAADVAGDGDTALELLDVNTTTSPSSTVTSRDPHGDDIARQRRRVGLGLPILMLTAADRLDDKASGFELGADDYLDQALRAPGARPAVARARPPPRARTAHRSSRSPASGSTRSGGRSSVTAATSPSPASSSRCSRCSWAGRRCRQRRGPARAGVGRERRPVHQRGADHRLGAAQAARRAVGHRHGAGVGYRIDTGSAPDSAPRGDVGSRG